MGKLEDLTYWRPQVMRHRLPNGRFEYAVHEVYFSADGSVVTDTVDALSERKGSVEELAAWLLGKLPEAEEGIVCGDLEYTYGDEDLTLWLAHIHDPPIDDDDD